MKLLVLSAAILVNFLLSAGVKLYYTVVGMITLLLRIIATFP